MKVIRAVAVVLSLISCMIILRADSSSVHAYYQMSNLVLADIFVVRTVLYTAIGVILGSFLETPLDNHIVPKRVLLIVGTLIVVSYFLILLLRASGITADAIWIPLMYAIKMRYIFLVSGALIGIGLRKSK